MSILVNSKLFDNENGAKELNNAVEEYQRLDAQIKDLTKTFNQLKAQILEVSADGTNQTLKWAWDIVVKAGSEKVVAMSKLDDETIEYLRNKGYIMETKGSRSIGKIKKL